MNKIYTELVSKRIRLNIIKMSFQASVAHIPSAFSMCDYLGCMFANGLSPKSHRFILGKPFGAQAYYALFSYFGWIKDEFGLFGTTHPEWRYIIQKEHPLITYIDESMGNCISVACGIALAGHPVFVNVSDAAFQEGTIWESMLFAGSHNLKNIIMSIDNNGMQALGKISDILDLGNLEEKIKTFGWDVVSLDGHNIKEMNEVLREHAFQNKNCKPLAIVFHTKKGYGLSFMEQNESWHYKVLTETDFQKALFELA